MYFPLPPHTMCTCVCVYKHVHACENHKSMSVVFLINSPSDFLRQDLSLKVELADTTRLMELTASPRDSFLFASDGITSHQSPAFLWVLEIEVWFSCLHNKGITNWAVSSRPSYALIKWLWMWSFGFCSFYVLIVMVITWLYKFVRLTDYTLLRNRF